jgi:putative CocE/NonD family hydrolase
MSDIAASLPLGVATPSSAPRRVLDPLFEPDLTAARTIEVDIPMRDGALLAADVHLPPADQLPAPAIVIGTPYDKASPFDNGKVYRDAGYVAVVYDCRGRGKSEGEWHPYVHDSSDGHDVVEWAAGQDWCDGKVGVNGISYLGWVVWATMAARPPHLRAAVSTAAAGRWQQEIPLTYGCMQLYFARWFAGVRRRIADRNHDFNPLIDVLPFAAIGEKLEITGPGWWDMLEKDTLDDFWRGLRWDGEYDFDVPTLHVSGWHDKENIQGAFHHYEQMVATSPAAADQFLLVGPWSHLGSRFPDDHYYGVEYPDAGVNMDAIHLRFFDHYLKGEENGVDAEPRVNLYDPGAGRWRQPSRWQADSGPKQLFLAAGGSLVEAVGEDGEDAYRYDPMKPNGIPFDVNQLIWEPPLDLAGLEAQEGIASWTGEPLAEEVAAHGWGQLELHVASDREDTEFHVKLADVGPDGRALQVAWGCLRASHGDDLANPKALEPGEVRRYGIELTPAFHTFKPGHRIRVIVAGSEFPWFARNLNRFEPTAVQVDPLIATNTVHRGQARPSCLRLAVER